MSYASKESIEITVKDSHFISYCGAFKLRKLVSTLLPYALNLIFIYLLS